MPHARETIRPGSLGEAADLLLRWPAHEPLAALVSGGGEAAHNAWTILARPSEAVIVPSHIDPARTVAALRELLDGPESPTARGMGTAFFEREPAAGAAAGDGGGAPPFTGGWIVALGYGLGASFEPHGHARTHSPQHREHEGAFPQAVLYRADDAWCLEHATGLLHKVGNPPPLAEETRAKPWHLGRLSEDEPDLHYAAQVARTVEYIRAGDAFQANLARRFRSTLAGCARSFARDAIVRNGAWFGALIDLPDGGTLVSMSPELFLRVKPDGTVTTRPIKGTRPASTPAAELDASEKDAAELAMIVDLMRNDLGRVAEFGSVEVKTGRMLETHTTVHHGVAEVRARLAAGTTWTDLLAATFPPGSVTGAPKVRAMQIIDELELEPRGFYCGALGFVSRSGHAGLSVAIRTAQVSPPAEDGVRGVLYHAGCGIVADSEPFSEVAETHAKARALAQLAEG
jgi:anthranilate/para-aminobenzoate synthase component I